MFSSLTRRPNNAEKILSSKHFELVKYYAEHPNAEYNGECYRVVVSEAADECVVRIDLYANDTSKVPSLDSYYDARVHYGMSMDADSDKDEYIETFIEILQDSLLFCKMVRKFFND